MKNKAALSIAILGVASIMNYIITFFLTPYITENIGVNAYGFVSIAKTFVSYGEIVTVALTSFVVRYISVYYHKGDITEARSYYVSAIKASCYLAILMLCVFAIVIVQLHNILNIPQNLVNSVKALFAGLVFVFLMTLISTPFSVCFYIKNRLDIYGAIKIMSYIVEMLVLIVLFAFFKTKLWYVGSATAVAVFVILAGSYCANHSMLPELKYSEKLFSTSKVKTLLKNGIWNSLNQLGNTLNSGLDLLVSNALLSGNETGEIAIAKNIGAIFAAVAAIIFQPLQPGLLREYSKGETEDFYKKLISDMVICGFFGSLLFAGFFALGYHFYTMWLPNQNTEELYILTVITVFSYVMDIFLQPLYYVNTLTLKNKIPCFVTIAGGILNVIGMCFLIRFMKFGMYAVPVTTAFIMFIINVGFNPMYASWCLKLKKAYFYPVIARYLLATSIMCVVFIFAAKVFHPLTWRSFAASVSVMCFLGIGIYYMIMQGYKKSFEAIKSIMRFNKK